MKKLLLAAALCLGVAAPAAAAYVPFVPGAPIIHFGNVPNVLAYNLGFSCLGCGVDLDPYWRRHDNANDNYAGWYCGGNGWSCWYYDVPAFLLADNDNWA